MAGSKVYITRRFPGDGLEILSKRSKVVLNTKPNPPSRSELLKKVSGADGILCMLSDRIDKEVMQAAGSQLRIISSYSTGFDHIDVKEATARGIYVTFTSDVLAEATADLTFALLLACARKVVDGDNLVRRGKWRTGWTPDLLLGTEVHGATLGIIGLGRIGSAVAKRAKGFGMKVLYNNRERDLAKELECGAVFASLDKLLPESDFVSIHTSLNPASRHMIDMTVLEKMKRSAFLINTARGQVVNERDLARALRSGTIAGAGLDVFEKEPLTITSPLTKMKNVVLLPHIGSASRQTRSKMGLVAVTSIIDVLEGREPKPEYTVNPEVSARLPGH